MPLVSTQKIALQLLHPHKHPKLTSMKSALWRSLGDVVSAVKSEVNQVKIRTWAKIGNVFFLAFLRWRLCPTNKIWMRNGTYGNQYVQRRNPWENNKCWCGKLLKMRNPAVLHRVIEFRMQACWVHLQVTTLSSYQDLALSTYHFFFTNTGIAEHGSTRLDIACVLCLIGLTH